jgi:hypothetical protein
MTAADDRAVIAALRAGHAGAAAVREAAGLKAAPFKAAVQRLRYQGRLAWDSLRLTPSMMDHQNVHQDVAPAPPGLAPVPAARSPGAAGPGEDAGATAPSAPASEPAPSARVRLLSAAEQLLRDIDAWCARTATPATKLGAVALRYPGYVGLLRKRLTATPDMIAKVRAAMAAHPQGMGDVPMPRNNICVPAGPKSESAARALAAAKRADLAAAPNVAAACSLRNVAEAVQREAEQAGVRRKAARMMSGRAGDRLALLPDATAVELVTTVVAETVDDAARAMARRWPKTWMRVLAAARMAEERPGEMLIRVIELGLGQVEANRG